MRRRVILVDDDALICRSFLRFASIQPEIEARAVSSLAALVELPDVLQSDLIVIDINLGANLPSGVDVYRWLREAGFTGEAAFLTGHATSHPSVAAAVAAGGARVFEKPIDMKQLRSLIAGSDA